MTNNGQIMTSTSANNDHHDNQQQPLLLHHNPSLLPPHSFLLPPFHPRNGEEYTSQIKEQFDSLLPKYGGLWRSMADSRRNTQRKSAKSRDNDNIGGIGSIGSIGDNIIDNRVISVVDDEGNKENVKPTIKNELLAAETIETPMEVTTSPQKFNNKTKASKIILLTEDSKDTFDELDGGGCVLDTSKTSETLEASETSETWETVESPEKTTLTRGQEGDVGVIVGNGGDVVGDVLGNAWFESNESKEQNETKEANETPFLDAILNHRATSFRVTPSNNDSNNGPDHELCGDDCNCAEPILEMDDDVDDDDAMEFTDGIDDDDSDDNDGEEESLQSNASEDEMGECLSDASSEGETLGDQSALSVDEDSVSCSTGDKEFVQDGGEIDDSTNVGDAVEDVEEEEVVEVEEEEEEVTHPTRRRESRGRRGRRAAKSRVYILESDDEDEMEDSRSQRNQRSSEKSAGVGAKRGTSIRFDDDDDEEEEEEGDIEDIGSATSEEEFIDLSSDDDGDDGNDGELSMQDRKKVNTVIILSSDEELSDQSDRNSVSSAFSSEESDNNDGDNSQSSDDIESPNVRTNVRKPPRKRFTSFPHKKPSKISTNPPTKTPQTPSTFKTSTKYFQKRRDSLTTKYFTEFNQTAFQNALSSVRVSWSKKLNTTAGVTRMKGTPNTHNNAPTRTTHHNRSATIELATKVIDDEERLRSTLLHEMCHAAAWLVDGVHKPPHGGCFKKWAAVSMKRIKDVKVTTTHDYQIAYKYAWACTAPNCNVVIQRHSRSVDLTRHCCGRCKSQLVEIEVPGNKSSGKGDKGAKDDAFKIGYTPKKERKKPSGFALFVKLRSEEVRKNLAAERVCSTGQVSQADVMRECGKLWKVEKDSFKDSMGGVMEEMAILSIDE